MAHRQKLGLFSNYWPMYFENWKVSQTIKRKIQSGMHAYVRDDCETYNINVVNRLFSTVITMFYIVAHVSKRVEMFLGDKGIPIHLHWSLVYCMNQSSLYTYLLEHMFGIRMSFFSFSQSNLSAVGTIFDIGYDWLHRSGPQGGLDFLDRLQLGAYHAVVRLWRKGLRLSH